MSRQWSTVHHIRLTFKKPADVLLLIYGGANPEFTTQQKRWFSLLGAASTAATVNFWSAFFELQESKQAYRIPGLLSPYFSCRVFAFLFVHEHVPR